MVRGEGEGRVMVRAIARVRAMVRVSVMVMGGGDGDCESEYNGKGKGEGNGESDVPNLSLILTHALATSTRDLLHVALRAHAAKRRGDGMTARTWTCPDNTKETKNPNYIKC